MKLWPCFPQFLTSFLVISFCFFFGCASSELREAQGPSVSEALAVSAGGPKARIAVAQFINNSGGYEASMQRAQAQMQAQITTQHIAMAEYYRKMVPYQAELMAWQERASSVGQEKAGPPPKPPEMDSASSSPYMTTIVDPVAGAIRDMMINAMFNSGKFIVLERQSIDNLNWEQEFSRSGHVGDKARIPMGQIEGAELLLVGSLNTLEAEESGGNVGGVVSSIIDMLPYFGGPYVSEATEAELSWTNAKAVMELRLIDTCTSRVVAAGTVEGTARSAGIGASRKKYSYNAGELPQEFSIYQKTPVEEAFRKMVDEAVKFLVSKTPPTYYHQ